MVKQKNRGKSVWAGRTGIPCSDTGHIWMWSGSGAIPEGTRCNCGDARYKRQWYCQYCGHKLNDIAD